MFKKVVVAAGFPSCLLKIFEAQMLPIACPNGEVKNDEL